MRTRVGLGLLCMLLIICHIGCGSVSSTPPVKSVPVISVTVSPASATVNLNGTQQFTAAVANDSSNKGVTWTLAYTNGVPCTSAAACGSISQTATPSGVPITYTAPPTLSAATLNVTITAHSVAGNAYSASAFVTVPGVSVSVSPNNATVLVGETQQFTATVSNDSTNGGVAWTLTVSGKACSPGCGTIAPSNSASGIPATYTAPAALQSDLNLTIAATSVALITATASATITVPAIAVSVRPASAWLPGGTAQQFVATVKNDPKNQGVDWVLAQGGIPCSPGCGSLSTANTASGSPTVYTAPTVPAKTSVTLTVASVTDGPNAESAAITLSNGTVQLVPDSLTFGQVLPGSKSSPQTVTLTNTGGAALAVTNITITGTNANDFSETKSTCGSSVGAGLSCAITVTFNPSAGGSRTANISITDTSTDSPQQVTLLGSGKPNIRASLPAVRSNLADTRTVAVPMPTGPETVGTRVFRLNDPTRDDPFLANSGKRELLVRFWYPAALTEPCIPAEYASPRVWSYLSQLVGVPLPAVATNSCVDAPVTNSVHPVVVFTHGYTGTFTDDTFLFEELASHGYIVASVDHTYEATAVEFPDGRLVSSKLGSYLVDNWRGDDAALAFAVKVRLLDLRSLLNELERLNSEVDNPFAGRLDVSRFAVAGYSLGGTTAFLALEQDVRFRAAILLDSYLPTALIRPTRNPVLVLSAGHVNGSADQCRLWSSLRGTRVSVNLNGAEHLAASDMVWLAKGAVETGSLGPESTVATIREQTVGFLNANLRDKPMDPVLIEPSLAETGVVTQGQSPCREP